MAKKDGMNKKEEFEIFDKTRQFEIQLFWHRALFFGGFISIIFVGYYNLEKNPDLQFFLSILGFICSFVWTLVNKGSKFWQENWEGHISHSSYFYIFDNHFRNNECNLFKAKRFSPSKLAIALSFYIMVLWLILVFIQLKIFSNFQKIKFWLAIFTFIYIIVIYIESKPFNKKKWEDTKKDDWQSNFGFKWKKKK